MFENKIKFVATDNRRPFTKIEDKLTIARRKRTTKLVEDAKKGRKGAIKELKNEHKLRVLTKKEIREYEKEKTIPKGD